MTATKATAQTPFGTATRMTVRRYTHVVVSEGQTLAWYETILRGHLDRALAGAAEHQADADAGCPGARLYSNETLEDRVAKMYKWAADARRVAELRQADLDTLAATVAKVGPEEARQQLVGPTTHGWCGRLDLAQKLAAKTPGAIICPVDPY